VALLLLKDQMVCLLVKKQVKVQFTLPLLPVIKASACLNIKKLSNKYYGFRSRVKTLALLLQQPTTQINSVQRQCRIQSPKQVMANYANQLYY
jgi:hypothetical protein